MVTSAAWKKLPAFYTEPKKKNPGPGPRVGLRFLIVFFAVWTSRPYLFFLWVKDLKLGGFPFQSSPALLLVPVLSVVCRHRSACSGLLMHSARCVCWPLSQGLHSQPVLSTFVVVLVCCRSRSTKYMEQHLCQVGVAIIFVFFQRVAGEAAQPLGNCATNLLRKCLNCVTARVTGNRHQLVFFLRGISKRWRRSHRHLRLMPSFFASSVSFICSWCSSTKRWK